MPEECDFDQAAAKTEQHALFKPFEGTFKARVRIWMGPDVFESTGVMTNTLELGGRFLHQVYKGDPSDGPFPEFEGRGYWGYNTALQRFEGFWIDTASTFMQTEAGDVDADGRVWTMQATSPGPDGEILSKRSVVTLMDKDHHRMDMYFDGPDGEHKAMDIEYERA